MPDTPPQSGVEDLPPAEQRARAELRERYAASIRRLWRHPDDCPICGSNSWNIGDLIQTPLRDIAQINARDAIIAQLASTGSPRLPQVYLYVPVTCLVCGYTLFFHSGVLDIREEEEVEIEGPLR